MGGRTANWQASAALHAPPGSPTSSTPLVGGAAAAAPPPPRQWQAAGRSPSDPKNLSPPPLVATKSRRPRGGKTNKRVAALPIVRGRRRSEHLHTHTHTPIPPPGIYIGRLPLPPSARVTLRTAGMGGRAWRMAPSCVPACIEIPLLGASAHPHFGPISRSGVPPSTRTAASAATPLPPATTAAAPVNGIRCSPLWGRGGGREACCNAVATGVGRRWGNGAPGGGRQVTRSAPGTTPPPHARTVAGGTG